MKRYWLLLTFEEIVEDSVNIGNKRIFLSYYQCFPDGTYIGVGNDYTGLKEPKTDEDVLFNTNNIKDKRVKRAQKYFEKNNERWIEYGEIKPQLVEIDISMKLLEKYAAMKQSILDLENKILEQEDELSKLEKFLIEQGILKED